MRILFIVEHFYPHMGGAEKCLLDLAIALKKAGHGVRVLTSNSGGITGVHEVQGVEIHSYRWRSFFGHPVPSMKDLLKHKEWANIIQTSTYTAAPYALRLGKVAKVPVVVMAYEYLGNKWFWVESPIKAFLFKIYEYVVYHRDYSYFIAISEATKKDIISGGISSKKIQVVYPVFNDFKAWKTGKLIKPKNNIFLFYGRPGKTKGVIVLVKAINLMKKEKKLNKAKFEFILSSDPPANRARIINYINKNNLSTNIIVKESMPLEKLIEKISNCYCIIVPSVTEGFGYSAYQASLMGKNIIVSDAGSLPEVVFGNALVFSSNSEKSLAKAIEKAIAGDFGNLPLSIHGDQTSKLLKLYSKLLR